MIQSQGNAREVGASESCYEEDSAMKRVDIGIQSHGNAHQLGKVSESVIK